MWYFSKKKETPSVYDDFHTIINTKEEDLEGLNAEELLLLLRNTMSVQRAIKDYVIKIGYNPIKYYENWITIMMFEGKEKPGNLLEVMACTRLYMAVRDVQQLGKDPVKLAELAIKPLDKK